MKNYKLILLLAFFWTFLDQFSKYLVSRYLQRTYSIIDQFFKLELSKNNGIAFGINIGKNLIIIITIFLIFLILYFVKKELNLNKNLSRISISLILGGALGNLISRFTDGYVIDFIAIWEWPNFNLADIYISIGILMIVTFYGRIRGTNFL